MFTPHHHKLVVALAALGLISLPIAVFADNNPQNGQHQNSSQQDNRENRQSQDDQQNTSQDSQDRTAGSKSGSVLVYREVNVDGTQHFRVRLKTSGGSVETVDLGPSNQNQDLINNIEQGDHITVQGQSQKINGKQVFVANQARVEGKTYEIAQANGENGPEHKQGESDSEQANNPQNSNNPGTVVLLDERFVFLDEGNLNRHLILAKENLRMGDTQAAAGELRVAAQQLDLYANATQGRAQTSQSVKSSQQELDRLADQISKDQGKVQPEEIAQAAARAQLAIAKFYDDRIESAKGGNKSLEAGYALQAAATHTREALMWSGENVPADAAHCVHQAMKTADELISGNPQPKHDATQVAQALSRQIDQIDQQLGQSEAQPAGARLPAERNEHQSQQQQQQSRADQ